jgi:formiminotetrahydrofolate cyclodeaminase
MEKSITSQTVTQFTQEVSDQSHAMAGAVIALSAGQAAALGQACMQISQADLGRQDEAHEKQIERLNLMKNELLQWCDRDANAIAEFVALRDAGETLKGQRLLCNAPARVSRLSIEIANMLQDFRPFVGERVRDDLEMSISLLAGTGQAALLLLDSNLRIWPEQALLSEFDPIRNALIADINTLSPVKRILV